MKYISVAFVTWLIFDLLVKHWDKIIKRSMYYEVYLSKNKVYANDNLMLFTEVTNRKILPVPWMTIEIDVPPYFKFNNSKIEEATRVRSRLKILTSLLFFEKIKKYYSFKCTKRGVYYVKYAEVVLGDYLGMTQFECEHNCYNKLIVYPEIKDLTQLIYIPKTLQGDISVRRWIINDPTQILGVRKYNYGDSFNMINWKTTARNRELYVNKFDFTSDPSIMLFLDVQTEKIYWRNIECDLIEKGIDVVASILDKALKERIPVGYTANSKFEDEIDDVFIYPNNSKNQKDKILEALAKTTYQKTYYMSQLINDKIPTLGKCCTIMLLVSYISADLCKTLNYYVRLGYNIKLILINKECNIRNLHKNIEIINLIDDVALEDGRCELTC